jgi:hypothetical protein
MSIFSGITESIANWYKGKYIPPPDNDPNSSIVFISPGHYEQPLLARILGAIGHFVAVEWKWLLGFIVAILALYANFFLKR